jgi:hypothetical protein
MNNQAGKTTAKCAFYAAATVSGLFFIGACGAQAIAHTAAYYTTGDARLREVYLGLAANTLTTTLVTFTAFAGGLAGHTYYLFFGDENRRVTV